MNRTFYAAFLACLLVLIGLVTLHAPLLILAVPICLYLLLGILFSPAGIQIEVDRKLSAGRVLVGERVLITLKVTNQGSRTLEEVLLEDLVPPGLEMIEGSCHRLVRLPAGGSVTWTYALRGRRGSYSLGRLRVTAREQLGLVSIQQTVNTAGQLFIVPPVLRLRRVAIQPRRTRVYSGSIPARQGGPGIEFFDVREYQTGDPPRWINWHLTARHPSTVYANQFEQERVADVGLILDGRRIANDFGGRTIFEHSVLATASLADAFLNAGNRVGMFFYGKQIVWTLPGYGRMQVERILHDLSRLEPGDSQVFSDLYVPRNLFPSHSQLVLISPLAAEDDGALVALRSRGYHLLVISPDPVSFELEGLPKSDTTALAARIVRLQRNLLLHRLRATGIQVVEWDVSRPFEQVAREFLERRPLLRRGIQP
ncbi:MAG: DUF58 domain-containing protein [Anaerolineales bacterium]|jgi:uncharacterized repeat protein (TIGR01451 family)